MIQYIGYEKGSNSNKYILSKDIFINVFKILIDGYDEMMGHKLQVTFSDSNGVILADFDLWHRRMAISVPDMEEYLIEYSQEIIKSLFRRM